MPLLKTILVLILVYYLVKLLAKLFAPKIINYAAKKTEAHFKEKFGGYAQPGNNTTEQRVGDIIVEKKPANKSDASKPVGDYIDFEEID